MIIYCFAWSQCYKLPHENTIFFVYTTRTDWLLKRRKNRRRVSESKVKSVEVFVLFSCCFSTFFFSFIFSISRSWPRQENENPIVWEKLDGNEAKQKHALIQAVKFTGIEDEDGSNLKSEYFVIILDEMFNKHYS